MEFEKLFGNEEMLYIVEFQRILEWNILLYAQSYYRLIREVLEVSMGCENPAFRVHLAEKKLCIPIVSSCNHLQYFGNECR